jgi:diaminopimelate epimerase
MGKPRFAWNEIPLARIPRYPCDRAAIGPIDKPILHFIRGQQELSAIFWVDDVDAYSSARSGRCWRTPMFPGAPICASRVVSREHMIVRTWERGAG